MATLILGLHIKTELILQMFKGASEVDLHFRASVQQRLIISKRTGFADNELQVIVAAPSDETPDRCIHYVSLDRQMEDAT